MSKKIEFIATVEEADYLNCITPSQTNIPTWYKEIPVVREGSYTFQSDGRPRLNLKNCMPFYDALSFGYQIVLASDIHFNTKDGSFRYNYPVTPILEHRDGEPNVPLGGEFVPVEFVWKMLCLPKTPKGYSCLITHPLNRPDIPFYTMSGIIDSDVFYHSPNGNLPFYMKKDFKGVIKKGTPIAQVLPFKRDNWNSSIIKYDEKEVKGRDFQALSVFKDFYKKIAYVKKVFR